MGKRGYIELAFYGLSNLFNLVCVEKMLCLHTIILLVPNTIILVSSYVFVLRSAYPSMNTILVSYPLDMPMRTDTIFSAGFLVDL